MSTPPLDELARKKRRHRNERIAAAIIILLLGGMAATIVQWAQREDEALRSDPRYIPKDTPLTREHELLRELVRIDTSTPEGVEKGARWIAAYLQRHGVAAELIEPAPGRFNVYARIRGAQPGEGLLLFNHIDVVRVKPKEWKFPPFSAEVSINQIYGRGVLDMKALAICQMLAMIDIARSGRPPAHDLVFLATADEETGSAYGMRWLLEHRPDIFSDIRYGITEGGITEMMSDEMTYFGIEIGGKQTVEFRLIGQDEESARRARLAMEPLMFPREPDRVLPAVRRYFDDIAPTRIAFRPYLADIDGTIRDGKFWYLPAPYRDLTQNTVWVESPRRAGDHWEMLVRLVNLPDEEPNDRIHAVVSLAARFGLTLGKVTRRNGPVPISTSDTPLFRVLAAEAARRYHVPSGTAILYRSTTDSRFLRPRGIICYGLSPYPVTYDQSITIHSSDERIGVGHFLEGVAYFRAVIAEWARMAA